MRSLITGITGQTGSFLAEYLLNKGEEVHGLVRRGSTITTERINHLLFPEEKITLHYGDLVEGIDGLIYDIKPDVIYNLGAMSHVKVSFDSPVSTIMYNTIGPLKILEAIRRTNPKIRFYQASSSECFGLTPPPQNEHTQLNPSSPYGASKVAAFFLTRQYRMGYGLFASTAFTYNHESHRRGRTFVTSKICHGAARIKLGKQDTLELGNLSAKRDWSHAMDICDGYYRIMNHDRPDEWVIASGEQYSVDDFVSEVFGYFNLDRNDHVVINPKYFRPVEVPSLLGDASKIRKELGWEPRISFKQLVKMMCDSAMEEEKCEKYIIKPWDFEKWGLVD